jgi:hypothetical protein
MRNPVRTVAVLLVLLLAGAGSGALAMPTNPHFGEAARLLDSALAAAGTAITSVGAIGSAGLAHVGSLFQSHGLAGLSASPTLLVGFLVGVGASTLALVMVLVVVATRRR